MFDTFVDIVDMEDMPVPLYDVYNHHYLMYIGDKGTTKRLYAQFKGRNPIGHEPCWRDEPANFPPKKEKKKKDSCSLGSMSSSSYCMRKLREEDPQLNFTRIGGATGGEFRHNPHKFPEPFGHVVPAKVESVLGIFHLIDTRNTTTHTQHQHHADGLRAYSPYLECPCTRDRVFDFENPDHRRLQGIATVLLQQTV